MVHFHKRMWSHSLTYLVWALLFGMSNSCCDVLVVVCGSGAKEECGPEGEDGSWHVPAGNGIACPLQTLTKVVGPGHVLKHTTFGETILSFISNMQKYNYI